jgi:hypothetical protein
LLLAEKNHSWQQPVAHKVRRMLDALPDRREVILGRLVDAAVSGTMTF